MQVQSLGQEDPLEEDIATHFSMLVWRTPRTEQPGGLQSMGSQRVGHDWSDFTCMHSRPIRKIKWDNENEGLPLCSSCQDSSVILVFWVKAMVFPVVMYGCESWTVKKVECWRIDAFELWWWTRLLRVPWTARKSNTEYSLEGLILKLKHLLWPPDAKSWL